MVLWGVNCLDFVQGTNFFLTLASVSSGRYLFQGQRVGVQYL